MNRTAICRSTVALAATLSLAACATAPQPPAPVTSAPPAAPTRGFGEMAPIPNPQEDAAPTPRQAAPARPAGQPAPPRAAPPRPAAPAANPGRAAQLRASGLEQLNRGAVDRAIALLQQASQLDPNNALIKRDLERAIRIGAAVNRQ